ncbi:MAG: NUDIX hydrolase [Acetatifactor sp.]|nr:NUDIX hydrolase [Acetatifactor sp.]
MQGYNVIVVFDQTEDRLLLCRRRHDPYKGLSNFVGGKIEAGEDGMAAAYRELEEETSITAEDIRLTVKEMGYGGIWVMCRKESALYYGQVQ